MFGAGVFFSVALMHMLAESVEIFASTPPYDEFP